MVPPTQYPGPRCPGAFPSPGHSPGPGWIYSWLGDRRLTPSQEAHPSHKECLGPPAKMKPITLGPIELGSS